MLRDAVDMRILGHATVDAIPPTTDDRRPTTDD
jgi:hypothetical protein